MAVSIFLSFVTYRKERRALIGCVLMRVGVLTGWCWWAASASWRRCSPRRPRLTVPKWCSPLSGTESSRMAARHRSVSPAVLWRGCCSVTGYYLVSEQLLPHWYFGSVLGVIPRKYVRRQGLNTVTGFITESFSEAPANCRAAWLSALNVLGDCYNALLEQRD